MSVGRGLAALLAAALFSCGRGAPGGFAGPASAPARSAATSNTIRQGSPAPPPTSELPAGDTLVTVTLARGGITPTVREVRSKKVAFVVSNDDDVPRRMKVATTSGTPLVGLDDIRPGAVATLSVELVPGAYTLVAEGGGKGPASVGFRVTT